MVDEDILEWRAISWEIQSEGYIWCSSLYITLEKNEDEKLCYNISFKSELDVQKSNTNIKPSR